MIGIFFLMCIHIEYINKLYFFNKYFTCNERSTTLISIYQDAWRFSCYELAMSMVSISHKKGRKWLTTLYSLNSGG